MDDAKRETKGTYNRTILELKRRTITPLEALQVSYNRTILELKRTKESGAKSRQTLIIAPYWN